MISENEAEEDDIEFLEAGEDSPETLETTEQPLDFVASLVHVAIVLPGVDSRGQRRHHGCELQSEGQLACLVTFICPVHEECGIIVLLLTKAIQQLTSFWSVVGLSGGKREGDSRSSIRGDHMNLGGPAAAGFADGLGTVFFSAPVPSGCTLTMVLSIDRTVQRGMMLKEGGESKAK